MHPYLHAHTRLTHTHAYLGTDPLLVSGVGMDWPMMEWDSFEDMANVVAPKLSSGSRNVHPWPDALSPEVGQRGHHRFLVVNVGTTSLLVMHQ